MAKLTLEEVGAFLAEPAPRAVPRAIRKKARSTTPAAAFLSIGLIFLVTGGAFTAVFFPWRFIDELRLDLGSPATVQGRVLQNERTSMSVNKAHVFRVSYEFSPSGGDSRTGVCYTRGPIFRGTETARVEYAPGNPAVNRLQGTRINPFGYGAAFVLIFPLIGAGFTWACWRSWRRIGRLLTDGAFTLGRITGVNPTDTRINHQPIYKVEVTFSVDGLIRNASYEALGEETGLAKAKKESGEEVGLLYDPGRSDSVLLAETLLR